jgi:inner membrane protein
VAVYTGDLEFEGCFAAPDFSNVATEVHRVRWHDSILPLAVSDVSGLKTAASLQIDGGTKIPFEPSIGVSEARDGIHARIMSATSLFPAAGAPATAPMSGFDFKFTLTLNGSSELTFAPVAQGTTVNLSSD